MIKLNKKTFMMKSIEVEPVKILNISLISSKGIADGKMLPVIFLDTTNRKDIENLLKNQEELGSKTGSIETAIAKKTRFNNKVLLLMLMFKEPIECNVIVEFEIEKYGFGLDLIIKNQGCYIQSSIKGDRLSTTMGEPRVLVEVHSQEIRKEWRKIYFESIVKKFKKKGMSKDKSKELAESFIKEIGKMDIRM